MGSDRLWLIVDCCVLWIMNFGCRFAICYVFSSSNDNNNNNNLNGNVQCSPLAKQNRKCALNNTFTWTLNSSVYPWASHKCESNNKYKMDASLSLWRKRLVFFSLSTFFPVVNISFHFHFFFPSSHCVSICINNSKSIPFSFLFKYDILWRVLDPRSLLFSNCNHGYYFLMKSFDWFTFLVIFLFVDKMHIWMIVQNLKPWFQTFNNN